MSEPPARIKDARKHTGLVRGAAQREQQRVGTRKKKKSEKSN